MRQHALAAYLRAPGALHSATHVLYVLDRLLDGHRACERSRARELETVALLLPIACVVRKPCGLFELFNGQRGLAGPQPHDAGEAERTGEARVVVKGLEDLDRACDRREDGVVAGSRVGVHREERELDLRIRGDPRLA